MDMVDTQLAHLERLACHLREDPEASEEEVRAAPGPGDHVQERLDIVSTPAAIAQEPPLGTKDARGDERQVVGPLDPALGSRLDRLAALPEEREELDADADAVHGLELGEDERLGELGEPRHDVGHGEPLLRDHPTASRRWPGR